jgi:hypothetical protein
MSSRKYLAEIKDEIDSIWMDWWDRLDACRRWPNNQACLLEKESFKKINKPFLVSLYTAQGLNAGDLTAILNERFLYD